MHSIKTALSYSLWLNRQLNLLRVSHPERYQLFAREISTPDPLHGRRHWPLFLQQVPRSRIFINMAKFRLVLTGSTVFSCPSPIKYSFTTQSTW